MGTSAVLFSSFIYASLAAILVSFWANKLRKGISCLGIILSWMAAFLACCLFMMFATEAMLVAAFIIIILIFVISAFINIID